MSCTLLIWLLPGCISGWAGGYPYPTYNYGQKRVLQDWFEGHGKKKSKSIWLAICRERCNMAILRQIDVDSLLSYITSIGGPNYRVKLMETAGQPLTQVSFKIKYISFRI